MALSSAHGSSSLGSRFSLFSLNSHQKQNCRPPAAPAYSLHSEAPPCQWYARVALPHRPHYTAGRRPRLPRHCSLDAPHGERMLVLGGLRASNLVNGAAGSLHASIL